VLLLLLLPQSRHPPGRASPPAPGHVRPAAGHALAFRWLHAAFCNAYRASSEHPAAAPPHLLVKGCPLPLSQRSLCRPTLSPVLRDARQDTMRGFDCACWPNQLLGNFVCRTAGTAFGQHAQGFSAPPQSSTLCNTKGQSCGAQEQRSPLLASLQWTAAAQRHETRTMADNFVTVEPTELKFRSGGRSSARHASPHRCHSWLPFPSRPPASPHPSDPHPALQV
jgi:hypothetical protein